MRTPALRATALVLAVAVAAVVATGAVSAATVADVEALLKQRAPNALAQAQALVDAAENSARAWTLLARAQLQKGEAAEAVDSAERAVKLAPTDAQAQLWLGNSLGVRIGEVNMLRKMAMAPDLRDAFEAAVRLDPNLFDARTALIQFYLQAPEAIGGGKAKAEAQVAEIAKRHPVRGHLAQATLDRVAKDDAAYRRSIDAAVAAAPGLPATDIDVRAAVVGHLVAQERHVDAKRFIDAWAQAFPTQASPQYQRGRLAAVSGEGLDEGAAALKRYLDGGLVRGENDPRDGYAWWRLGQIQARQGDTAAARTSLQTALRLEPSNSEAKKALDAL